MQSEGDATAGNIEEKQPKKHSAKTKASQVAVRHIRNFRQEFFQLLGEDKVRKTFNN